MAIKIKTGRHYGREPLRLKMTAMIDVVFLLLVFFLLSVNFRPAEGFLPNELPRAVSRAEIMELEPLLIVVRKLENGCRIEIDNQWGIDIDRNEPSGFSQAASAIETALEKLGRRKDDPVKLVFDDNVLWQDTQKSYDMLREMGIDKIIYGMGKTVN